MHHGRRPRQKFRPMPTLYDRAFATADDHSKYSLLWDMDSIPFVIDNPATDIIFSHRILFTGPLFPTLVTQYTVEGLTTATKLFGSMKVILSDDVNNHRSYFFPVYLLQRLLSIFLMFQPLEHYLVIIQMQLILLKSMVTHSRIGLYLGHPPFHAGSIVLVWGPTIGRVSPQ